MLRNWILSIFLIELQHLKIESIEVFTYKEPQEILLEQYLSSFKNANMSR